MSHVAFEAEAAAKTEHPRSPAAREFEAAFHRWPQSQAQAPGRVDLLGGDSGCNDGLVLAVAIPQQTRVAMAPNREGCFRLRAAELGKSVTFTLDAEPQEHFARYVHGCLRLVAEEGIEIPPLDIHVASDVPIGAGLGSSAALEVATLRCLRRQLELALDDMRIAQFAQQAEIRFAGVRCGIADQMAVSLAGTETALLLDTRSLERRPVPLPAGTAVLVLDAGVPRSLAASIGDQRRADCEEAARRLGVASLRDVDGPDALAPLPDALRRRARHVLAENARVRQAAGCTDAAAFGERMNASHASLRDDYEGSTAELDRVVDLLQGQPGVLGARMSGGACVALCRADGLLDTAHAVLEQYSAQGHRGRLLVPVSA